MDHRHTICHLYSIINSLDAPWPYFFFNISFTNRHEHSFERLSDYVASNMNKYFFTGKCSCNILLILVILKPNDHYLTFVTCRSCFICSCTASIFCGTTNFGRPSRSSSWSELRPRLNKFFCSHRCTLVYDIPRRVIVS